jgi:hypothetical protein
MRNKLIIIDAKTRASTKGQRSCAMRANYSKQSDYKYHWSMTTKDQD